MSAVKFNNLCMSVLEACTRGGEPGFRCRNLNCVEVEHRCDGHDDCGDRSDEYNCQGRVTTVSFRFG